MVQKSSELAKQNGLIFLEHLLQKAVSKQISGQGTGRAGGKGQNSNILVQYLCNLMEDWAQIL